MKILPLALFVSLLLPACKESDSHRQLMDYEAKMSERRRDRLEEEAAATAAQKRDMEASKEWDQKKDEDLKKLKIGFARETRDLEDKAATAEYELKVAQAEANDSLTPKQKAQAKSDAEWEMAMAKNKTKHELEALERGER